MIKIVTFLFFCILMSCAKTPDVREAKSAQADRIRKLSQQNQSLKDENRLLRELSGLESLVEDDLNEYKVKLTEVQLYSKALASYQKGELKALLKILERVKKTYPKSQFLDNIYYLVGRHYLKNGQLSESLKFVNEQIKLYPKGNRKVSAYYVKAMVYKNLNLLNPSRRILSFIIKKYPKSREAKKAAVQLKKIR